MRKALRKNSKALRLLTVSLCALACALLVWTACPSEVFANALAQTVEWNNASSGYSYYVNDEAGFLADASDSDVDALLSEMQAITEFANVALVTTTDHSYSSTKDFARNSLEAEFGYSNGIIFVIDRDLNQIYLLSEGSAQRKISSNRCNTICDNTYVYATASYGYDYYTCCYQTFSQVNTLLQGGRVSAPMKYICNALLSIALGLLISYIIARATSKSKKAPANKVLFGIFSNLSTANPQANYVNTTRTYVPPSSSGGGGGGGGSSGGGGGGGGGGCSGGGHGI